MGDRKGIEMDKRDDGGPAFPATVEIVEPGYGALSEIRTLGHVLGMSLRDWFAGQALLGLIAAPADSVSLDAGPHARANPNKAAAWAYDYADAMLAEKAKGTT